MKYRETSSTCSVCGLPFRSLRTLSCHLRVQHQLTLEQLAGPAPLCRCGCGDQVSWNKQGSRFCAYIIGHRARGSVSWRRGKTNATDARVAESSRKRSAANQQAIAARKAAPPLCACGCSTVTAWDKNRNRYARYVKGHAARGRVAWHRGKTVADDPRIAHGAAMGASIRNFWKENPERLAEKERARIKTIMSAAWRNSSVGKKELARLRAVGCSVPPAHTPRGIGGWRPDLPHAVRSTWEANVARVLIAKGARYDYEPCCFDLPSGRYIPDFRITSRDGAVLWIEVKGWATEKWKRIEPEFRAAGHALMVIDRATYRKLAAHYRGLVAWETQASAEQLPRPENSKRRTRTLISYTATTVSAGE